MFLTRGRLPISSFLCFIGGFSMGSWLTLFNQLQIEQKLADDDFVVMKQTHEPTLLLAVLILSAPRNFEYRYAIRSTWLKLNPSKSSVQHFFIVGMEGLDQDLKRRLHQEQIVQGDMVLLTELEDTYDNLTLKLTLGLSHLTSTSPFYYAFKCDDNTFARIDLIVKELQERQNNISQLREGRPSGGDKCYYWGFFDGRARVQKKGKWKETEYNLCDFYLPYALGGGYVLSKKCTDFIVRNHGLLKPFKNEDASVGTWLAGILHEKRHDVRFDTEYTSRGCSNKYLVQHQFQFNEIMDKYKHFVTTGLICSKETRLRPSYEYHWELPPSQCCKRDESII